MPFITTSFWAWIVVRVEIDILPSCQSQCKCEDVALQLVTVLIRLKKLREQKTFHPQNKNETPRTLPPSDPHEMCRYLNNGRAFWDWGFGGILSLVARHRWHDDEIQSDSDLSVLMMRGMLSCIDISCIFIQYMDVQESRM